MIEGLPKMYWNDRFVVRKFSGARLLRDDPEAKDVKGNPINPNITYSKQVRPEINHKECIEAEFKFAGMDGAKKYIEWCERMEKEQGDEQIRQYKKTLEEKIKQRDLLKEVQNAEQKDKAE